MLPFEPRSERHAAPTRTGVVTATVTDNADPESAGRVCVRFSWLSESEQSSWARVATPMGGSGRGFYALPEVGDEVVVAFEHGDINYPVVIGALWNGTDLPPQANGDGQNNIRQMVSRSGHQLTFDDTDGSETFILQSSAGHKLAFDDSAQTITLQSDGGNKIVIDDSAGTITLEDSGGNSLTMEASGTITLKSSGDLNLEGMNVTIKAGASLKLEGSAGAELTSSAIAKIQGSLVQIN